MPSKLHRNVVYQGVELLLLVAMLFLPAIPKSVFQVDFGYIAVLKPLIKVYPWTSLVLLCHGSASSPKRANTLR